MYTDQQITDLAKQLESKGATPADIVSFVSKAKSEQTGGGGTTPDPLYKQSADQFHPMFAATGQASDVAKVVPNILPSAGMFALNSAKFLASTPANVAKIPGQLVGLNRDVKSMQQGEVNLAQGNQQLIEAIRKNKAEGRDTSRLVAQLKQNGQDVPPDLGELKPGTIAGKAALAPIPVSAQHLAGALYSYIKGDSNAGDTKLAEAEAAIVNDPVGQILPWILMAKSVADLADTANPAFKAWEQGGKQGPPPAGYGAKFDALMNKVASPVTGPASAVGGKIVAPFAKSALPETEAAFAEQGIKPPTSAITKSPFIKGAEALVAKGPFGAKVLSTVTDALTQIQEKTNAIVSRLTPEKIISDENLGKTIQEGLDQYETNFKQTSSKIYDQFNEEAGNPKAIVNETLKIGREVVNQQSKSQYGGVDAKILNMVKRFNDTPDAMGFEELKATRTAVGEALSRDPTNTGLKRIYGALSKDMDATVKQVDPTLGDKLDEVNKAYATGKAKIESNIASSIEKSNPERIANNLVKRNSADTLAQVKEMIGPDRFAEVTKVYMRQLMEDSVNRGKFDVNKLKVNLDKLDPATRDQLMSPEQQTTLNEAITQLEKLQKLQDSMKSGQKMSEGSPTTFTTRILAETSGAMAGLMTALVTGRWEIAVGILTGALSEAGIAKFMGSVKGQQFLTKGFKLPTSPNVPSVTTPLGAIKTALPVVGNTVTQNTKKR